MRIFAIALTLLLTSLRSGAQAQADGAAQISRDGNTAMVSKDVGAERWAISYRIADGFVTGNVFFTDGRPTTFLSCERTSVVGRNATFDCYSADPCLGAPCPPPQYSFVSEVSLSLDFFFPPEETIALQELLGRWRFEVSSSEGVSTWDFELQSEGVLATDQVVLSLGIGQDAVRGVDSSGEEVVVRPSTSGYDYVLIQPASVACNIYQFDLNGDEVHGVQWLSELAGFGATWVDCLNYRINDVTNSFAGRRQ